MDEKVRIINWHFLQPGFSPLKYFEFAGPSTATKPTENVCTGSLFHETDTTKVYAYDESTETWYEQCALGGDA